MFTASRLNARNAPGPIYGNSRYGNAAWDMYMYVLCIVLVVPVALGKILGHMSLVSSVCVHCTLRPMSWMLVSSTKENLLDCKDMNGYTPLDHCKMGKSPRYCGDNCKALASLF